MPTATGWSYAPTKKTIILSHDLFYFLYPLVVNPSILFASFASFARVNS